MAKPPKTPLLSPKIHLNELKDRLLEKHSVGAFDVKDAAQISSVLATTRNADPLNDPLLLELHCLAACIHDQVGEYEKAQSFIGKWASDVQFEVAMRKPAIDKGVLNELPLYAPQKAWLLKEAGVAAYRLSKFDAARGYLQDATILYQNLLDREPTGERGDPATTSMLSTCFYWLGCVDTYANKFKDAELHFLDGLQREAEAANDSSENNNRLAKYNSGRLLMGLGLLKFHLGALKDARTNLLAAKIILQRDSRDEARQRRAEILLLSVQRMETPGDADQVRKFENIIGALENLAQQLKGKHMRYFCRAKWTIGLAWLGLADVYRPASAPPREENIEAKRNAALQNALKITEEQRPITREHGSVSDQLQLDILNLRVLRRIHKLDEAIKLGNYLVDRVGIKELSLLYTEVLFGLGHAYYDRWKKDKSEEDVVNAKKLFIEAAKIGEENPRAEAVSSIHLARIAHRQGLHSEAEAELGKWERLKKVVNLQWIRTFADRVRAEIDSQDLLVFSLSKLPDTNVYDFLESQLKTFLVDRVVSKLPVDAAVAKLGISRQTLYNWRRSDAPEHGNASANEGG